MKSTLRAFLCTAMLVVCGCPVQPVGTTDIVDAVIAATATRGPDPLTVTFSGAASTSRAGAITAFSWDFAGLGAADTADATFTFDSPGRYPVKLTVTDAAGNVGAEILDIRVQGENPVAVIATNTDTGPTPLLVRFDGTASSASDDRILDYFWDFDDGQTSRLPSPQHVFNFDGQYTVTLRVVTAGGAEGVTTTTITASGGVASLKFEGTQLATLPVSPAQTLDEFTVEAWCLPDTRGGTLADIGNGAMLLEVLPEFSVIRVQKGSEAFELAAGNLAGDWIHVALVYDASGTTIVLNGAALDNVALLGELEIAEITIGSGFEGRIADLRFWSVARTSEQINTGATTRLVGNELYLLSYWPINEGLGEVLRNRAPIGADGYLGETEAVESADPDWSSVGPPL